MVVYMRVLWDNGIVALGGKLLSSGAARREIKFAPFGSATWQPLASIKYDHFLGSVVIMSDSSIWVTGGAGGIYSILKVMFVFF